MHFLRPELRDEIRAVARLALPVVIAQLGMMMLGVVDVMMVGRVDEHAMAAVAAGHTFSFAIMIFAIGAIMVLDPVVSQAWGAQELDEVSHALWRGIVIAILLSIVVGVVIGCGEPFMFALMGRTPTVAVAYDYSSWLVPGLPAYFLFFVARQVLQAMSVMRPIVIAAIVGNVANLVLNWALIFGHLGCAAMGAPGSAMATSICRYVMLVTLVIGAWPALKRVVRRPDRTIFEPKPYGKLLVRGTHIGLQSALEVWVFNAVGVLMIRMGELEMASHQIAHNLSSISFMVPFGIGAAAATRVGNAVGRGDVPGARRAAIGSLVLGGAVMLGSALLFLVIPRVLSGLYTNQESVITMAIVLLPIAAIFQVFDGVQAVGCGVLRGIADTKAAAVINFVGHWLLGLPVGVLLAHGLGYGPAGLWWGLTIGLAAVAVLLVVRIRGKVLRVESIARM